MAYAETVLVVNGADAQSARVKFVGALGKPILVFSDVDHMLIDYQNLDHAKARFTGSDGAHVAG